MMENRHTEMKGGVRASVLTCIANRGSRMKCDERGGDARLSFHRQTNSRTDSGRVVIEVEWLNEWMHGNDDEVSMGAA